MKINEKKKIVFHSLVNNSLKWQTKSMSFLTEIIRTPEWANCPKSFLHPNEIQRELRHNHQKC